MVARALHVLHAAMYDAWAAHDDLAFGSRLGDELRRPAAGRTPEAKREAASFAGHRALSDLFPTEATAFAKLMGDLGYDPDAAGPEGSPGAVGVTAARAVLAFRHGDGANQLGDMGPEPRGLAAAYADWTGYRPANPLARLADPNRWQPLPTPDGLGQRFLGPHWGLVVPFALGAGWELRPRAGPGATPGAATCSRPSRSWPTAPGSPTSTRRSPSTGPTARARRPHPATGACTPRPSRPATATAWTRT
jgi:hypothetical protein